MQGFATTSNCNVDDYAASKDKQLDGETCRNAQYGEAAKKEHKSMRKAPKRVRNKSMSNKQQVNWVLGMRRHLNNQNAAERIGKITIKRDKINTVTTLHSASEHRCIAA